MSPEYSFKIPNEKPEELDVLHYFIAFELYRESYYYYFIRCPFSLAAYICICFLHDCSRTHISACLHVYHKFTHTYECRYHSEAYTKHRKRGNWIHAGALVLDGPRFWRYRTFLLVPPPLPLTSSHPHSMVPNNSTMVIVSYLSRCPARCRNFQMIDGYWCPGQPSIHFAPQVSQCENISAKCFLVCQPMSMCACCVRQQRRL